ncbi:MAG: HEAT repeat domain-containing protein [Gemmatimonadota bacterium]
MRISTTVLIATWLATGAVTAQRRPLAEPHIADITTLVLLEDRRDFNADVLTRILGSDHPEVRRRAAQSIARINDPRGRALLHSARSDADTSVAATAVFGIGQLRDSAAVPLLDSLLSARRTPVTVAFEAARALGKIRTPESREVLAKYLLSATEASQPKSVIGEALLSMGRQTTRGSSIPIARFTNSKDEEIRWRATWALFRPRDPVAASELLRLSSDASGHVRSWAIRALGAATVDSARIDRNQALLALIGAARRDSDRRVRTEAIRTMIAYDDSASFAELVTALNNPDTWISVSAAEALARRTSRSDQAIAALTRATAADRPSALRIVAVQSLLALSAESARAPGELLATDSLPLSRQTATTVANRLAQAANPPARGGGAGRGGGGGRGRGQQRPLDTGRTEADYRRIVERWVLPAYNGAERPRARWDFAKGSIELELYAGDAPLAVEDFMKLHESGAIVGAEFSRVVPDFVVQQRGIYNDHTLRDEITRLGLTRANLSWASSGLDTGRPGYTLGHTPQPHNEGDFTTLGRVVRGIDVVDRLDLGDRIVAARIISR